MVRLPSTLSCLSSGSALDTILAYRLSTSIVIHECAALLLSIRASQEAIAAYRRCRLYGHALLLACLASQPKTSVRDGAVPPYLHLTHKKKSEAVERFPHSHEEFKQPRKGLVNQDRRRTGRDAHGGVVKELSHDKCKHGDLYLEKNINTGDQRTTAISRELKHAPKQQQRGGRRRCQRILLEWAESLAKKGHRLAACVAVASADAWLVASSLLLEEVSFLEKPKEERRQHPVDEVGLEISETVGDSHVRRDLRTASRKLTLLVLATLCAIRGSEFEVEEDQQFDQKDNPEREEGEEEEDYGIESEAEESLISDREEASTIEEDDSQEKEEEDEEEDEEEEPIEEDIHHVRYAKTKTSGDLPGEDHALSFNQPMRRRRRSYVKRKAGSFPVLMNAVASHFPGLVEQSHRLAHLQPHANHINVSPQGKHRQSLHDDFISYLVRTSHRGRTTMPSKTQQECAEVLWRVALVPLHLRLAACLAGLGSSFAEQVRNTKKAMCVFT